MKIMSDDELIAMGLQVQEARRKGGMVVLQKFGKKHFSLLGKRSAEKKKLLKNEAKLTP